MAQLLNTVGLKPSGFQLSIQRYPDIAFPVQMASIPSVSMRSAIQPTRQVDIKHPGEKISFPPLSFRMLLDSEMKNYATLFSWMHQNASPEMSATDLMDMLKNSSQVANNEGTYFYSDVDLIVLNNLNNPVVKFTFEHCYPVSLGSITVDTTINGQEYLTVDVEMEYTSFTIGKAD